jgi:hypothetical protein
MYIAKVILADLMYNSHKIENQEECYDHLCMTCKYGDYTQNELPCSVCCSIEPMISKKCFWESED